MTDFTDSCASGDHLHEKPGEKHVDIPKQQAGEASPSKRTPHETEVRSRRPRRMEEHWKPADEMEPGLLKPQEKWVAEFEQTKRRDRHNLTVLLALVGYLVICGLVAAWLLVSGVDQQTVNMFLQVFVVSLIPVIAMIARGFHR